MFNSEIKKESENNLKYAIKQYDEIVKEVNDNSLNLYNTRIEAIKLIEEIEKYINKIANTKKTFDKDLEEIKLNIKNFRSELEDIQTKGDNNLKANGRITASGVLTGAGIATLAPTVAMAIATTFGTASTGAAIASLSGAAATNAALAWLGGGALTAGGAGMAGGSTLLALAGPIGWSITGATLAGSAFYRNKKNKEITEENNKNSYTILKEATKFYTTNIKIEELHNNTIKNKNGVDTMYNKLLNIKKIDYNTFTKDEKFLLGALVNNTKGLSKSLSITVVDN